MTLPRLIGVASATIAAACAFGASTAAAKPVTGCAKAGYSYAGVQTLNPARGMAATITPLRLLQVSSGHVAAWVGVGGAGMGAGGRDEWLQIGISALPGGTTEVYYEVTLPGADPQYTSVEPITNGESHRMGVVEQSPNVWVAVLDGHAVSPQFTLPGSHGNWAPMATTESYDGGFTACNSYSFRLDAMSYAPVGGPWLPVGKVRSFDDVHALSAAGVGAIVVNRH